MTTPATTRGSSVRRMPIWLFVAFVVVYLVIVVGVGKLLSRGIDGQYAAPQDANELWRSITVPVALGFLLCLGIVAAWRWWRPAYVDDRPVRSWLIAIPVIQVVTILVVINYGGLGERGLGFTALLLVSCLFVGFAEELLFRGIGVTAFRGNGFAEGSVALWTTIIFGLAHASNLISEGGGAFVQVFAAALSGYFFYLTRRRTRGLLAPSIIHGLWDFSLISAAVVGGTTHSLVVVSFLALAAMAVLVLVKRHSIEPEVST